MLRNIKLALRARTQVPTLIVSAEESNCDDTGLDYTVDGDSLTYWRPSSCSGNVKIMYSTSVSAHSLTGVQVASLYDGTNGVVNFNVMSCDSSSVDSATCVLMKECTLSATSATCDLSGTNPTRFVMIEITQLESTGTPYLIGVEFFEAFTCESWSNCVAGEYVIVQPTSENDRVCLACPSGYTSTGLNSESCVQEDGCVDANVCGDHGTCVDNVPPYVVFEREAREFQ